VVALSSSLGDRRGYPSLRHVSVGVVRATRKMIITGRIVCERSISAPMTIFVKRDDGPSTRCNCSITLCFLVSISLPCLFLFVSLLSPSHSHTRPVVSSNDVLHFVIQYVGVRARRRHFGFARRDGPRRPDTCMRVTPVYTFRCVFRRACRRKSIFFLRALKRRVLLL